jgi:hypothetical protein
MTTPIEALRDLIALVDLGKESLIDWNAARAALAQAEAQPSAEPVDWLPYDDQLRFVARVLEGNPPQKDKDDAAAMVRAMRGSLRPRAQPAAEPAPWMEAKK